ncbi:unnamed protein product, partial [Mesorhabditis spiculigera]
MSEGSLLDSLQVVLGKCNLNVERNQLEVEQLAGGLTNGMYLIKISGQKRWVYRVNGTGTEILVDREAERQFLQMANEYAICPKVLFVDEKRMLQEFCDGITLGLDAIDDPNIHRLIARKLARLHGHPIQPSAPWYPQALQSYLKELDDEEMSIIGTTLLKIPKDTIMTLCHNDLRLNNVIYQREKEQVFFVDFEYAGLNYAVYDIAHYFWQHNGAQNRMDFQTVNPENRKLFASEYLRELYQKAPTKHEVDALLKNVLHFEAANHFLWSIWSRIQHKLGNSTAVFSYQLNARARFECYEYCLNQIKA